MHSRPVSSRSVNRICMFSDRRSAVPLYCLIVVSGDITHFMLYSDPARNNIMCSSSHTMCGIVCGVSLAIAQFAACFHSPHFPHYHNRFGWHHGYMPPSAQTIPARNPNASVIPPTTSLHGGGCPFHQKTNIFSIPDACNMDVPHGVGAFLTTCCCTKT